MTGSEPDFDEKPAGEADQEEEELDSQPDSEDPERDSDEPPGPVAQDRSQPDEDRWGIGSRVLVLAALLGSAILVWTQFAFRSKWIADFLESNKLESPDQRMTLIAGFVGGLALGGAVGAAALAWLWSKRRSWQIAEQWAWFLSPLIALPIMPIVFRFKPWQNRHQALLLVALVGALVFETLLKRAFAAIPEPVQTWLDGVQEQVPAVVRRQGPRAVVIAAALGYALFMSFYFVRWHYKLRTHNFDLSINNNLIYGGLHGKFLESTVVFPTEPGKYLANHAKFGTYLFLPIYALFPRPETLLVLQSFMLGLSALPLYGFARRHVSDTMAAAIALVFLCYYPMHSANFSEFQNVPIATFFLFSLVWAAETRRWLICGLATAAALLLREDIPIGVAVIGGFLLLSGYRSFPGFVIATGALTYFVYLRFHVMDDAGEWWYPNMYKDLWADGEKGYKSVIKTLITNPLFVLSKLIVEKKLIYLLHLLVPVAFLPARRWYLWAAFVPGVFLTLLVTNYDPPALFSFHYVMHWAPYLFLAVPLALEALGKSLDSGIIRMRAAATTMVCVSLVLTYNYGAFAARPNSLKGGYNFIDFNYEPREIERYERLRSLVDLIPRDASVAATETVGPHVSSRVKMFTMRHGPMGAEYVLASSKELKLSRTKPTLKAALESGQYGVIKRAAEFVLLKRGADTSQNKQLVLDCSFERTGNRRAAWRGKACLKKRLGPLFMTIALLFVAYSAWDLAHRWQKTKVVLDLPWALASILPLGLGCLIQGRGWIALIERMTARRVPRGPALSLYMDSQLARYTPGMVGLPFVRMAGAARLGVSAVSVGSSVGLEMLSWTAVGGAVGFASLSWLPASSGLTALLGGWAIPIVLGFAAIVIALSCLDRSRLPAFVVRVLKVDGSGPLVPFSLLLAHVLYWASWAAHGFLLTCAFGAAPGIALSTSGLYALATVGGFVALAAPAGVGVREAILSISLAPAVGSAPALAIAVASRAASLVADLIAWAVLKRWAR